MSTYTIADVLADLYVDGTAVLIAKKRNEPAPPKMLDGLKPKPIPTTEGMHTLSPEQLLNVRVDPVRVNGQRLGYQRPFDAAHARKMARAMAEDFPMPTIELALDGNGVHWAVEGQHRCAAGVIARRDLPVHVRRLTKEQRAKLFTGQRRQKQIDPNVMIMSGDGPFERYIHRAVSDTSHPWYGIVADTGRHKKRIGPYAMFQLLVRYVGNVEGQGTGSRAHVIDRYWDRHLADEMADLIRCFGDRGTGFAKSENPDAFRPSNLQAIGQTAMWVFRRRERAEGDYERWLRHMPLAPVDRWTRLVKGQREMTDMFIGHWNKGLRGKRRIERPSLRA